MIIHINDELRINGTPTCYQIEKKRKSGDWRPYKYYQTFAKACASACEHEFHVHPAQGIAETLEAARGLSRKYGALIDGALEEIAKRCGASPQRELKRVFAMRRAFAGPFVGGCDQLALLLSEVRLSRITLSDPRAPAPEAGGMQRRVCTTRSWGIFDS